MKEMREPPRRYRSVAAVASSLILAISLGLAGCATEQSASAPDRSAAGAAPGSATPEWRPGDRWVYEWKSGKQSGIKTIEVLEIKELNGVRYYVARSANIDHYYTLDLHWAAGVRGSKVQARMVPPQPLFSWPLEAGRRWTHKGTLEEQQGKVPFDDRFSVLGREPVTVPAGQFAAMRVVRQSSGRDSDEYWYAPEVGFYVKWVGRRGDLEFEEQLREFRAAPRLGPGPVSTPPPPAKPR
jgi:hypothetical protein